MFLWQEVFIRNCSMKSVITVFLITVNLHQKCSKSAGKKGRYLLFIPAALNPIQTVLPLVRLQRANGLGGSWQIVSWTDSCDGLTTAGCWSLYSIVVLLPGEQVILILCIRADVLPCGMKGWWKASRSMKKFKFYERI